MDYYVFTEADKQAIAYNRCFADAENGRVWLAFMRLDDLRTQFPQDPHLDYAEALIRIEYLGDGITAQELCWRAFQSEPKLKEALFNSVKYAPDRNSFNERISKAIKMFPNELGILDLQSMEKQNRINSEPYWRHLQSIISPQLFEEMPGECAALIQLLLKEGNDEIPPDEYAKLLRIRGESLRKIDRKAESKLQFFGERFLSEDRLALKAALSEFEKHLMNPYFKNMETLNLCSAWSLLLGLYNEAIKYADKAIELGSEDYIYPNRNKALALWGLGHQKESIILDEETLKKAQQVGDDIQVNEIKKTLVDHKKIPPSSLSEFLPTIEVVLNGAGDAAFQEITSGKSSLEGITPHFIQRIELIGWKWSVSYVPIMSEMFAFFSPEAAHFIISQTIKEIPINYQNAVVDNIIMAVRYLASHCSGVLRRDAIRLITLQILSPLEERLILKVYRNMIRNISTAAETTPLSELANLVKKEMSRISVSLPEWLENQPPITSDELNFTCNLINERISKVAKELELKKLWRETSEISYKKSGCTPIFIMLFILVLIPIWYILL